MSRPPKLDVKTRMMPEWIIVQYSEAMLVCVSRWMSCPKFCETVGVLVQGKEAA